VFATAYSHLCRHGYEQSTVSRKKHKESRQLSYPPTKHGRTTLLFDQLTRNTNDSKKDDENG